MAEELLHYSAEDLARIQTDCIQLDNELQRQQQLWQAAHEVRRDVLPQVKEIMQVLQQQRRIADGLTQEIADLRTAQVDTQRTHEARLAGFQTAEDQARTAHEAVLAELARRAAEDISQRQHAEQQHAGWLARMSAELHTLRQEHATALAQAQEEQAQALAVLTQDRDRMQTQIQELQATRDQLTKQLQGQLTALQQGD